MRQVFNDSLQAREWEEKVLRRMKAVKSDLWLNKTDRHAFSPRFGFDNHNFGRFKGEDNPNFGKSTPEETKKKISQTLLYSGKVKGENNGMFGRKHIDESKRKMSDNRRSYDGENNPNFGKTSSLITREKISKKNRGKMWVTDGVVSLLIHITEPVPEGFRRGRKING